ncbi:MAG: imidazolonepropionase [Cryomorphaceae bacterium]
MKLFTNIKELHQVREAKAGRVRGKHMNQLPSIKNAWMAVKDGKIEAYGKMDDLRTDAYSAYVHTDLSGRMVLPTWVDSHTHLVFAEWRNQEFEDRIQGLSYQEIASRGGGILNSARKMEAAREDDLFQAAMQRLHSLIAMGTGAIEIKSGYGLTIESELKMLRVIKKVKENAPIPVKATFLGAHAFPDAYKDNHDGYVDLIINEMLPQVVQEGLADYIDAFCEDGYFNVEQTVRIMKAGEASRLKSKIHVNQFNSIGGVQACVDQHALSIDHLEVLTNNDLLALTGSSTLPVALPSCSFFLGIPYTPVRELMDADLSVVLATDYNPGSTPSGNMNFIFSLACIKMGMTPAEAVNAMTLNGAAAIELESEIGSISQGKRANFIVTDPISSLSFLPYAFGEPHVSEVYINGTAFKA